MVQQSRGLLGLILKNKKIILASGSPRRVELLKGLDIDFEICSNLDVNEDFAAEDDIMTVPQILSLRKSLGYKKRLKDDEIIITADTVVICDDEILGKPSSREEAIGMLMTLSGRSHIVVTGVTIRDCNRDYTFSSRTTVSFKEISREEAEYYVDNYSPYDKAGSYGVQEWIGYTAIKRIDGCYYNVMGLPVQELSDKLIQFITEIG